MVGARELRRTLRKAGDDLAELKAAHAEAAGIVAGAARPGAPRVSGALAGTVRPGATKTAAIVRAGKASVPYANPIHWGWGRRHIAANPWMSRAATSTENTWTAAYAEAVDKIIGTIQGA